MVPVEKPFVETPKTWQKWDPAGRARRFRGTTFVSQVVRGSQFYELEKAISDDLVKEGLARTDNPDFALMHPDTYHMTLYEAGLLDREIPGESERWPDWLDEVQTVAESARCIVDRLRESDIQPPRPLRMKVDHLADIRYEMRFDLKPADDEVLAELQRFRDEIDELLGIQARPLDSYAFHSGIGYRLRQVDSDDPQVAALQRKYDVWASQVDDVELETPAFCLFENMQGFAPLSYFE